MIIIAVENSNSYVSKTKCEDEHIYYFAIFQRLKFILQW